MVRFHSNIFNKSLIKLKIRNRIEELGILFRKFLIPDDLYIKITYKKRFGISIDLRNPQTLNEKMQWLKLYERKDFHTILADKYAAREYIAKEFGEEYLVPLLYVTDNYKDITPAVIPDCNCIIKTNHGGGNHQIIRNNKQDIDFNILRENLRHQLNINYYHVAREWQYNNMKRLIIIEKLLETKSGKIPNDYKLHFINGELKFIYVSYDREGINDRCIYDSNWNRLPFMWIGERSYKHTLNKTDVPKPLSFEKMVSYGSRVAKLFKLVRVDFYDVDGKLYFGEITLHHGAGYDKFFPSEYDYKYGCELLLK